MSTELLELDIALVQEKSSLGNRTKSKMTAEGILKDVHLIGLIGKSNKMAGQKTPYTYAEAAIKEAVERKAYEGVDIYIGHVDHDQQRNPKDKIGYVVAGTTKHKEGSGAFGDIQFNTAHPYFGAMAFWIEKQPEQIMMSHVADLKGSKESNQITKIGKVYSVDLVLNGNTTTGIHKEGVISDAIAIDQEKDKLRNLVSKAESLLYRIIWPINSYSSGPENKVLTDPEKAVLMAPIVKDLLNELKLFGNAKKEHTMEYKDIKLDDLKKECPELVKQIESAALSEEAKLNARVAESIKDVPADKRSDTFLKLVRESLRAGNEAGAKEIVADRVLVCKESATSTANVVLDKKEEAAKKADTPALTEADVLRAVKG